MHIIISYNCFINAIVISANAHANAVNITNLTESNLVSLLVPNLSQKSLNAFIPFPNVFLYIINSTTSTVRQIII